QPPADTFNPVIVDFYQRVGYLPNAIVNSLLLLGWALDDKTEFFTRQEMVRHFSLERVNKAPASFDAKKLDAFQERYMQQLSVEQKIQLALPYLEKAGLVRSPAEAGPVVTEIVQAAADRIKTAGDILDYADFFVPDDQLPYDEAAFEKRIRKPPEARGLLAKLKHKLAAAVEFDADSLKKLFEDFVQHEGINIVQIIHAVRVAVTGKAIGFGLFETLAILGKDRCLARIERALKRA